MRFALDICANLVGIPLEVLIIAAMLRGSYPGYPAPFAYIAAGFVVSLVESPLYIVGHLDDVWYSARHVWHEFLKAYWIDESVLMALVFVVVLSLIYQATEGSRSRRVLRASVVC